MNERVEFRKLVHTLKNDRIKMIKGKTGFYIGINYINYNPVEYVGPVKKLILIGQ